jgi:hypothetical protein
VIARAAEKARQAEEDAKTDAAGARKVLPQRRPFGAVNSRAQEERQMLHSKRRRLLSDFSSRQQQQAGCDDTARGEVLDGASDPQEALAVVQAAVRGVLAGQPGATGQLARLHTALRCSMP